MLWRLCMGMWVYWLNNWIDCSIQILKASSMLVLLIFSQLLMIHCLRNMKLLLGLLCCIQTNYLCSLLLGIHRMTAKIKMELWCSWYLFLPDSYIFCMKECTEKMSKNMLRLWKLCMELPKIRLDFKCFLAPPRNWWSTDPILYCYDCTLCTNC